MPLSPEQQAELNALRAKAGIPVTPDPSSADQGMYAAGKLGIGSSPGVDPRIIPAASEGLQRGGTIGFSDELQASIGSLGAKLLGGDATEDATLKDLYRIGLENARGKQEGLREDFPVTSAVSELAGGLATGNAAFKAAEAPLAAAGLGKAGQFLGASALTGGAAAVGYGEQENPADYVSDFVQGGALGAGGGYVLQQAIKGGGWLGRYIEQSAKTALDNKDVKPLTKAAKFVSDILEKRGVKKEDLQKRLAEIQAKAGTSEVPLATLADDDKLSGIAQGLAAFGTDQKAAAVRSAEHLDNLVSAQEKKLLATISTNAGTPHELAGSFKAGVDALAEKLTSGRRAAAKQAYEAVVKPENVIPKNELTNVMKFRRADGTYNTAVDDAIKRVRSNRLLSFSAPEAAGGDPTILQTVRNAMENAKANPEAFPAGTAQSLEGMLGEINALHADVASIPNNSISVLDAAYKSIGARIRDIDKGILEGGSFDKTLLSEARDRLGAAIMKHHPQYGDALDAFAEPSQLINKLFGDKKKKLLLGRIANMTNEDPIRAARMLFDLQPEEIAKTKIIFQKSGMPSQFDDAAKAHVMDNLARAVNPSMQKTTRPAVEKARLLAALGPQKYKAFESVLELADMLRDARAVTANSPTAFRESGKEEISKFLETKTSKAINLVPRLFRAKFGVTDPSTIKMLEDKFQDQAALTELTNILFDPKETAKFLALKNPKQSKAAPLLNLMEAVDRRIMQRFHNAATPEEAAYYRDSLVKRGMFAEAGDRDAQEEK